MLGGCNIFGEQNRPVGWMQSAQCRSSATVFNLFVVNSLN